MLFVFAIPLNHSNTERFCLQYFVKLSHQMALSVFLKDTATRYRIRSQAKVSHQPRPQTFDFYLGALPIETRCRYFLLLHV